MSPEKALWYSAPTGARRGAAMGLRLDLTALRPGHNRLHREADPADLGLPPEGWPAPVEVDLDVDRSGDQLTLTGRVRTVAEDDCARCLIRVREPLDAEIELHADRAGTGGRHERELAAEALVLFHDGRSLELADEVRGALLLARPMATLCRPDCRGLCSRCGADLNQDPSHAHAAG